jgi:hypothetical protein
MVHAERGREARNALFPSGIEFLHARCTPAAQRLAHRSGVGLTGHAVGAFDRHGKVEPGGIDLRRRSASTDDRFFSIAGAPDGGCSDDAG